MRRPSGFTLIEMLTVVVVLSILMLAVAPRIKGLLDGARREASVNTIMATVSAAKSFAMRDISFDGATYSGCAVIFTPSGRLRIVENRDYLVDDHASRRDLHRYHGYSGFADLGISDYVELHEDLLILGLSRGGGGSGEVKLLAPPFAIRINQYGNLVAGANLATSASGLRSRIHQVFYDRDENGEIDLDYNRQSVSGTYNPDDWDIRHNDAVPLLDSGQPHLPYEQIETLRGVVVLSRKAFDEAAETNPSLSLAASGSAGSLNDATTEWVMDNAVVLLFNHTLGVLVNKPLEE